MKFGCRWDWRGRQRLRSRAGVVGQPQASVLGRKRLRSGDSVYTQARTSASMRQRMRPSDDICCVRGVFFGCHPKCLRPGDSVYARVTTSALGRRRLPHAFMSRVGFTRPNCEYDKKEFLEPVQKINNLKINPPMGPVHL